MAENSRLTKILENSFAMGDFKPPRSLAISDRSFAGKDFYRVVKPGAKDSIVSYVGVGNQLWEKRWAKDSENYLVIKMHRPVVEIPKKVIIPFFKKNKKIDLNVLSIAAVPNRYNQPPSNGEAPFYHDFRSVDISSGIVGTAHFGIDFVLTEQNYEDASRILIENKNIIIPSIQKIDLYSRESKFNIGKYFFPEGPKGYKVLIIN